VNGAISLFRDGPESSTKLGRKPDGGRLCHRHKSSTPHRVAPADPSDASDAVLHIYILRASLIVAMEPKQ
jgi:hypothetical protein